MIKLLALDMDGTLLNEKKEISPANILAIHQAVEAGVKLVLCTGRILSGVIPYFKQLGLDAENEYVILNNGCALHQTYDWSLLDHHGLTSEEISTLATFAQGFELPLTLCDISHYYVVDHNANDYIIEDTQQIFLTPQTISLESTRNHSQPFFLAKFVGHPSLVQDFLTKYDSILCQQFNTVLSQPSIYEMLPKNISKATALRTLSEKLGIKPSEIMAIGDANNDLEMIAFAGMGIAMGNANEQVKAIAQDITDTNENNGVAKAIEKHILNK